MTCDLYRQRRLCACSMLSRVWLFLTPVTSLLVSSVHGILQARIQEWVSMPYCRGSSWPMVQTHVSSSASTGRFFITSAIWEAQKKSLEYKRVENCWSWGMDMWVHPVCTLSHCHFWHFANLWAVVRWCLCPWDFLGKNTWVGCHFLLQGLSSSRDWTRVSCIGRILSHWATWETKLDYAHYKSWNSSRTGQASAP